MISRRDNDTKHTLAYRENQRAYTLQRREIEMRYKISRNERVTSAVSTSMNSLTSKVTQKLEYAKLYTEMNRMAIVAKKEETDEQMQFDEHEARWKLDTFHYGGNLLAAISGGVGTSGAGAKRPSKAVSALAGALSGAAAGSAVYPGIGTAIGAAVGGIAGYLAG